MKSTVENLGPTRVRLAVELPFSELQPSIDAAIKKYASQLRIPGFRPGKAPARVIEQRVGRPTLLEEAVNETLPKAYSEAVREAGVQVVGQPDIEVTNLDDGNSLSFTAEVDVRPEITLPDYAGLAVTVDDAAATDEQVAEQLESLRDRFGTLNGVERAIQTGDYVSVDLVAVIDGQEVEGGTASGVSYEVGSGELVEGLDDVLVGASVGDSATFASKLSAGIHEGRDAEITVTVLSVKEKELPEVDDEFAQLASEFDTVEELRADLRTRLGRFAILTQGAQARDKVLEKLLEQADFELPAGAVAAEIEWRRHDVIHQLEHDDARFEEFLAQEGKTEEEFDAEIRELAQTSVRTQFLLDAIAEAENVEIGDGELSEYLIRQAQRYGMSAQEFANQLVQAGNLPQVMADVRRNKALAGVLERAVITDESGNPVDLSTLTADPTTLAEVGDADEYEDDDDEDGELEFMSIEAGDDVEGDDVEGDDVQGDDVVVIDEVVVIDVEDNGDDTVDDANKI